MKSLLIILILASACLAQDPVKQLSELTKHVEKQLSSLKVSDDLKQQCTSDLAEARRKNEKVVVLAVAVESEEAQVRERAKQLSVPISFVMASPELIVPFGTMGSVPRIFVFNPEGKTAGIFYGAAPDLHDKLGKLIDSLAK